MEVIDLFSGIGTILFGLSALGFVLFLHRIAKPIGVALVAMAKRDGGKHLAKAVTKLLERD